MSFLDPTQRLITYVIQSNHNYPNTYKCWKTIFHRFEDALDFSLRSYCYIKFTPPTITKPPLAQKKFCVETYYRTLCYIRNPVTYDIWKAVWRYCNGGCYYKNNFNSARKHYYEEINLYRQIIGCPPIKLYGKLNVMAQHHADTMAKRNKLIPDKNRDYDELNVFAKFGHGIYLMKLIFDSIYFARPDYYQLNPKQTDIERLLSCKQNLIGFGMAKNGHGAYITIKFTSEPW
uniref:SCP domain-containing protein n=1 Tax=Strongyloides papillosus TaxID=174720 RepID=A0A0N5C206_STREA